MACIWRSENKVQEAALCFRHLCSRVWTQVISLGDKRPFPPSYRTGSHFACVHVVGYRGLR